MFANRFFADRMFAPGYWPLGAESAAASPPDGPTYSATYQRSATYNAAFQQSADAYAATYQVTKTYESEWD